jgi:hypothetical protein
MHTELKLSGLAKYAWFVLAYNIVVIIWGVFLRASKSGDGCGQHWLTCHGEVIPSAPELKTIIEFSHRVTSGLDGIIVLALVVWAFLAWRRRKFKQTKIVFTAGGGFFIFRHHRSARRRGFGFDRQYGGNFDCGASVLGGWTFDKYFYFAGCPEFDSVVCERRQTVRF